MTLLTLDTAFADNPKVIQSTMSVTTTSTVLADDTQASYTFTLTGTRTVLVFYVANSAQGNTNSQYGFSSAINVDGSDYCKMEDSCRSSNYSARNSTFFVGQLLTGSHTIKGRLATNYGTSTITVSNRTLIVIVLSGDEAYYNYDNTHLITSTSNSYADDPYATFTQTPSGNCNALFLYAASNNDGATESNSGKKICINVGGADYTACEIQKSPTIAQCAVSLSATYALTNVSGNTTATGRYATATGTSTVTISNRAFAVLFFNPSVVIDLAPSTTQVTSSSTTLADDAQASISRTTSGYLLSLVSAVHKYGSTGSVYGTCYGLMVDGSDVAASRASGGTSTYPESNFVAYAQALPSSKSWVVKGRIASNYTTNTALVDSRCLIALWFPASQSVTTLSCSSTIAGTGDLTTTATVINIQPCSSTLAGTGALTTNVIEFEQLTSSISGTGIESATGKVFSYITSSISGVGALTATDVLLTILQLSSTIAGTGLLTANNYELEQISSSVSGTGALTTNVSLNESVASSLSGSGSITATILVYENVASSLSGSGSLTVAPMVFEMVFSSISGVGSETAAATLLSSGVDCSSIVIGTGSESANPIVYSYVNSTVAGTGAENATIYVLKPITSSISGSGSQTALASLNEIISSILVGSGSQTANQTTYNYVTSSVTGTGLQNAQSLVYNYISSAVEGIGTVTSDSLVYEFVSSAVAGTGSQSANTTITVILLKYLKQPITITLNPVTRTVSFTPVSRSITFT